MFQAGRFAPQAWDYVSNFATILSRWWSQNPSKLTYLQSSEDQLTQWTDSTGQCPAKESFWTKIVNKSQEFAHTMANKALSCLLHFLIYFTSEQLMKKAVGADQPATMNLAIHLISQEAGVFGSAYIFDWAKALMRDIHLIERSTNFTGVPLSTIGLTLQGKPTIQNNTNDTSPSNGSPESPRLFHKF